MGWKLAKVNVLRLLGLASLRINAPERIDS
jgi:hypothetical protein